MKLTSMVEFVLQQDITDIKQRDSIVKYANFLKQPLNLGMFVPCDGNGNFLYEPKLNKTLEVFPYERFSYKNKLTQYQKAKEKVLFEGFHIEGNKLCYSDFYFGTIYDISNLKVENLLSELPENEMPKLMLSAIKQIGL